MIILFARISKYTIILEMSLNSKFLFFLVLLSSTHDWISKILYFFKKIYERQGDLRSNFGHLLGSFQCGYVRILNGVFLPFMFNFESNHCFLRYFLTNYEEKHIKQFQKGITQRIQFDFELYSYTFCRCKICIKDF